MPWKAVFQFFISICLLFLPGCSAVLRYPGAGALPPEETSTLLETRMNARLLSTFWTRRLIVEVDWVEGCEPQPKVLASLEALRSYGTMPEDVCLDDYLDPLRREKRFRQLFPQCETTTL